MCQHWETYLHANRTETVKATRLMTTQQMIMWILQISSKEHDLTLVHCDNWLCIVLAQFYGWSQSYRLYDKSQLFTKIFLAHENTSCCTLHSKRSLMTNTAKWQWDVTGWQTMHCNPLPTQWGCSLFIVCKFCFMLLHNLHLVNYLFE